MRCARLRADLRVVRHSANRGDALTPLTPGGYKRAWAKAGPSARPPRIANAVADAVAPLGVAVTALPIVPERLRSR